MSINELANRCHNEAKSLGWYEGDPRTDLELLMLVVSELSEATEELRKPIPQMKYYKKVHQQHQNLENFVFMFFVIK